jgi:hypothetical protein
MDTEMMSLREAAEDSIAAAIVSGALIGTFAAGVGSGSLTTTFGFAAAATAAGLVIGMTPVTIGAAIGLGVYGIKKAYEFCSGAFENTSLTPS